MKKYMYCIVFLFPVLVFSQSTNQNYVKKTTYKTPTTTPLPASPNIEEGVVNITYFDGLGRPLQHNAHKQSATGLDIITHIEYDEFGRQIKEYLPYVPGRFGGNMAFDPIGEISTHQFYENEWEVYTSVPFSEKKLENSPLSRVLKQGAPGEDWQVTNSSSDHTIKFAYQTNTQKEVKRFKALTSGSMTLGVYPATLVQEEYYEPNQLYKTIITDENGSKTEEFKDKQGRVVLKRAYIRHDKHDTYYVYDVYGNLTYVIPPKAADVGDVNSVLDDLCYQYYYDSRNRLVEKKLPGKTWEYMVYDKLDRIVSTGPVLSPFEDTNPEHTGWLVTKYDVLGRVAYTGWYQSEEEMHSNLRAEFQANVNAGNLYVNKEDTTINGVLIGYDVNNVFPFASDGTFHLLTVNYYDDYNFPGAMSTLPPFTIDELGDQGDVTDKTKGLPTGSWVRVLTTTSEKLFEFTHIFYDQKARPIRTHHKNYLGGYTQTDTYLDFVGTPQYTITTHKRTNSDTELTVREDFEYTPEGRLLEHKHKVNNFSTETLSYNDYDELGQLKTKNVGSTANTPLQVVDYKYNIRGWLTDINDVKALGNDLFAFKIGYNTGLTSGGLYNGNISETNWVSSSDNALRGYIYGYDPLNRLNRADYRRYGISPVDGSVNVIHTNSYNENNITYDKNGNILSMFRTGDLDSAVDVITIDDLRYTYDDGNKLLKVLDNSNHPEGFTDGADNDEEYDYDIFGNMIQDLNKEITQITYNHLNLPKEISFSGTPTRKINYLYNATGQKVAKKITNNSTQTMTDYLNGFHYENNIIRFSATAEGYVDIRSNSKTGVTAVRYVYNYTDHLGNIRVSYAFRSTIGQAYILEENHYYPFGLKHKKYGSVDKDFVCVDENCYEVGIDVVPPQTRKTYQYKYNGKEFQDELGLNVYDYGARMYMPDTARMGQIDPVADASKNIEYSPYSYAINNPVSFIDPDGRCWQKAGDSYVPCDDASVGSTTTGAFGYSWTMTKSNGWQLTNGADPSKVNYQYDKIEPTGDASYYVDRYKNHIEKYNTRPPDYYLGYGHKYINRFKNETRSKLTELGKEWLDETAVALQEMMNIGISANRSIQGDNDAFQEFAYETHVPAYSNSGKIGLLKGNDLWHIMWTPDIKDSFLSGAGRSQIMGMFPHILRSPRNPDLWDPEKNPGLKRIGEF